MQEAQDDEPAAEPTTRLAEIQSKPSVHLSYEKDDVNIDIWVTSELGYEAMLDRATRAMEEARRPGAFCGVNSERKE